MASNLHPVFDQMLSPFMETVHVPLQFPADRHTRYCANCHEPIRGLGRMLPESLIEIFPRERQSLWCDLECLAEWIADYAMIIARTSQKGDTDE